MMRTALVLLLAASFATTACGPSATRGGAGTSKPRLDEAAMGVGLDKVDIDYLVGEDLRALAESRFWNEQVERAPEPPLVAIWPIENRTTQHLEDQMVQLLTSIKTALVNSGDVRVVSRSRQAALERELGIQHGSMYDAASAGTMGRQLGAQYFITGRITSVDERLNKTRRVQYSLFLQVLEIETGLVMFQHEASRTKQLNR